MSQTTEMEMEMATSRPPAAKSLATGEQHDDAEAEVSKIASVANDNNDDGTGKRSRGKFRMIAIITALFVCFLKPFIHSFIPPLHTYKYPLHPALFH
jgi:hypothetical protein